ncbi:MAG TPA: sugar transferase [Candidatus Synoicihabitans sp.]|nr:sugar transferase [Candidatus Synoicihabitans sp.]
MLTFSRATRSRLSQIADGALFAVALALAYLLRAEFPWFDLPQLEEFRTYRWLFPIVAVLGPVALSTQGLYDPPKLTSRFAVVLIILRGCAFTVVGLILLLFLLRAQFARSVILLVGGFGGLFVYARHEFSQWSLRQGRARRRVLWVGPPEEVARLQAALSGLEREAILTVGAWTPGSDSVDTFVAALHATAASAVVISLDGLDRREAEHLLEICEREGVEVLLRPGLHRLSPYRLSVDAFAGEPVLYLRAQAASPTELAAKQALDVVLATVLLVTLSPLWLAIALAVAGTSRGPILFRQRRAGLNGQPFEMLKFRSMRIGAERERESLAAKNQHLGPVFKLRDDPRVTWLGRFLRRHSLDELPQLWNVLRGEMSLVGPRPLPLEEVARFEHGSDRRRLSVKPGLTGLWQISGRSNLADFADWVRLDLAYIDQWSLWLDLKILLGTIPVVLLGRGGR